MTNYQVSLILNMILVYSLLILYFFFQAEDCIRDGHVTGVQTCALPISERFASYLQHHTQLEPGDRIAVQLPNVLQYPEIGRASCRERVSNAEVGDIFRNKKFEKV